MAVENTMWYLKIHPLSPHEIELWEDKVLLWKSNSWNTYHQDTYVFIIRNSRQGNKAKSAFRFWDGLPVQGESLILEQQNNKEYKYLFSQGHFVKSV